MSTETCLICQKSITWQKIFDVLDNTLEKTYTILKCPECRIHRTTPVPDNLDEFYPPTYFNRPQSKIFHFAKSILIQQELGRIHTFTRSKNLLDIGAGWGDFSQKAYQSGYSVIAADNSPHRPYYLQNLPEIAYRHFDYEPLRIDEPQETKNRVVVLRHVLEHIKNPHAFLSFFINHHASYFYIAVPNVDCLERKFFRQYDSFWYPPYHLWHFNQHSLKSLFERLGLQVMTTGFDTLPTVLPHVYFYMRVKKYPKFIRELFLPTGAKIALTVPLNLFFPNNVIWIIAKTKYSYN